MSAPLAVRSRTRSPPVEEVLAKGIVFCPGRLRVIFYRVILDARVQLVVYRLF
jgi:hypothetical protein